MKSNNINKVPWVAKFTIFFYFLFAFVTLLGNVFVRFVDVGYSTWLYCFIYFIFLLLGILCGASVKPFKIAKIQISSKKIQIFLLYITIPCTIIGWYYLIQYFGSLAYIMQSAYAVRVETIGDGIQIIPTIIGYLNSFQFAGLAISLSLYYHTKDKKVLEYAIFFGVVIILSDLQSFGRIGMLFTIFIIISYFLIYKLKIKFRKVAFYGAISFVLFMLPRYFRGGGSLEGVADEYQSHLRIKSIAYLGPLISVFCYYFSGIYALDKLLNKNLVYFSDGSRNFASLYNLFNRLFSDSTEHHRISIIANSVDIPFTTNIYTIVGELYMDFGEFGLFFFPLFFGICIGFLFNYRGVVADALKLVLMVWIFYTPIYNMFSFGAFLLAYITLLVLVLFTNE